MKTLLMISYPFPPNATAGAVRSERFARYLQEFGWSIDVVSIKPREDLFADTARVANLGENVGLHLTSTVDPWLWARNKNPNNRILRVLRSLIMELSAFPDHMLFWVPFAVRKGLEIHKRSPVDAIYTTSPPHSTHLAGLLLSKRLNIPWVADFRDPWTLNAYRQEGFPKNTLSKLERFLERKVYEKAAVILANTRANRKNLLAAFPWLGEDKVQYLPNGWEEFPDQFYSKGRNEVFTIVHAGTFYPRFRPYGLFHALATWRDGKQPPAVPELDKSIRIVLLGARDAETRKTVQNLGLEDWVEIRPWVALEEARKIMCSADLLWATLGTGRESATYVPSKLFEYMAAQKPILGFFPEGDASGLIRETRTGVVFTADDPGPVIEFLWKMKSAPANEWKGGSRIHDPNDPMAGYHIRAITGNLAGILEEISQGKSRS
ncbi:MAG: glycosyltransferase family 4 protein [Thermodesulfobacteriota bacterium]